MAIDSIESRDAWYTVGSDGKYEVDLSGGIRPISDDRLRDLANLPNLKTLTARDAAFTDSGLAFLKGCSQLESLVLDGAPQITDAGSVHFVGLNRLRRLSLEGTGVTADGIARLHKALPKCDIDW